MSTKIHKVMGWGAIHPNPKELNFRLFELDEQNEVVAFLRASLNEIPKDNNNKERLDLVIESGSKNYSASGDGDYPKYFNEIIHYAEYSDAEDGYHVIVPPLQSKNWYRVDDSLDYEEKMMTDKEKYTTTIKFLKNSPYPYNCNNGIGGSNFEELITKTSFFIPYSVRIIAQHFNFKVDELQPMIVTWWN